MAKSSEGRKAETPVKGTKETPPAPIKLQVFESDAIAVCDAETGICTVPNAPGPMSKGGERRQPAPDKRAHNQDEPSGN